MARKLNGRAVARALVLATLWLAVSGRPLVQQSQSVSDEDPLFLYGWGKITRLQYLYSAGPYVSNCFLHIRSDGSVDCQEDQNERSKYSLAGPLRFLKTQEHVGVSPWP